MRRNQPTRRIFLAGTAATLAAPAILSSTRAYAQSPTLRVGHVSPRTGPLAAFAEADDHIIAGIQEAFAGGLENNGRAWNIEIISKDSQSNPNRAAEVAADLILGDEVDIIVAASTPDTVNPVADQAEINDVPCISTDSPWQPYFFGRSGVPGVGFQSTYHFFFGIEDWIAATLGMWGGVDVGTQVAGMFPNDADGNAFGDAQNGLPPAMTAAGYTITDPGRYQPLTDDFSNQIAAFKEAGCTIVTGNMIPPDFATFWAQAAQQGFNPKIVTIGKALLFPSVIESLGARGDGLTTEVWWSPDHPFSSSLTGVSARDLTAGYTSATGRPWTQPIGFKHALFEVVADVVQRSEDLEDPAAIVAAIASTNLDTIVGNVNWDNGPINNVTKTPLVAGQWQKAGDGFDLKIVANAGQPHIPLTGELKLLG
ncbi:ABC transporter substrate-binding protein [Abyssibius alkaniclasticus]|uniref:ABC transporter substrate-binding protein n=1 Tax=Abyssibius alkaniclasticus TaxID=2881234 RepID=UPI002363F14D|nr:ABC transporter substrate-binding protein [Abyssibius alkaniclasticus]UPH71764.1 ABC transporter substrate-binding protein [Abyssibius alkaniclasticus]